MGVYIPELSISDLREGMILKRDIFNGKFKALWFENPMDEMATDIEIHPKEVKTPHGDLKDAEVILKALDDLVAKESISYANARRVIMSAPTVIKEEKQP